MSQSTTAALPLLGLLGLAIPAVYALTAISTSSNSTRRTNFAAGTALVLAAALALAWATLAGGNTHVVTPSLLERPLLRVRLDVVTNTMLVLVTFIGVCITRFSTQYLTGDARSAHFARWLMATLSAVTLLVVSNNLLVLGAAWIGTSLSLHQLLTVYRERTQALVAAHKKFLVSRVADACLAAAIAIVGAHVGSYSIDDVHAWAAANPELPVAMELAALLLVLGAALKCAQLPFHGWLTQVMEAPTPVSALLHAGVVNLGGVLMIRLAPLMTHAAFAQTLLVVIGAATAVIAALVMSTRVSIKVALAWSTIAQMGFMLVQCGLGAYHLAMFHIVAHSLYKAHAFLSSGSTVDAYRVAELTRAPVPIRLNHWLAAGTLSVLGMTLTARMLGIDVTREPAIFALLLVTALAPTPLIVRGAQQGLVNFLTVLLGSIGITGLGLAAHWLSAGILDIPAPGKQAWLGATLVILSFATLFLVQGVLQSAPHGRVGRALYPRLFAGLYLDELFTRLTFRIWPPTLPPRVKRPETAHIAETVEA